MQPWNCLILFVLCFPLYVSSEADVKPSPHITEMTISAKTFARFSQVTVATVVSNSDEASREAMFAVQVPTSGFISGFQMTTENKTLRGLVQEKSIADESYDKAKTSGSSAGKVSQTPSLPGRDMDNFAVFINVAGNSTAKFELAYQEVIERRLGVFEQKIHVEPMQIVPNLSVTCSIEEPQGIRVFSYILPNQTAKKESSSTAVDIRATPKKRIVEFRPSMEQQRMYGEEGVGGDFTISYDVAHQNDGGIVLVQNGYFVHYFSPNGLQTLPKNIIFVIDISGSMSGFKLKKVREVMQVILGKLKENDFFNILLFDDKVSLWKPEPERATAHNIEVAKKYADETLVARGSTNINSALLDAIDLLRGLFNRENGRGKVIVFLTDGHPTAGVTVPQQIRQNVKKSNEGLSSIFALGFGFDVDMPFLEALAYENGGFARRIYEESDANEQLENFYDEISRPLLVNVRMDYPPSVVVVEDATNRKFPQYFDGSEIVVSGKLRERLRAADWQAKVTAEGDSRLEFTATPKNLSDVPGVTPDFVERYWAFSKIRELLKKALIAEKTEQRFYRELALNMSLAYQFVTPLTSMVVTEAVHASTEIPRGIIERDAFMVQSSNVRSHVVAGKLPTALQTNACGRLIPRFAALVLGLISVVIA